MSDPLSKTKLLTVNRVNLAMKSNRGNAIVFRQIKLSIKLYFRFAN